MGQEPEVVESYGGGDEWQREVADDIQNRIVPLTHVLPDGWNESFYVGGFKVCYNPPPAKPWSIILDNGIDIQADEIYITAPVSGRVERDADNVIHPRAWLEGAGKVTVVDGVIYVNDL